MRRNLFVRLLGLFLGVAVFSIAATAWITTQSTSDRLRGQFERTLEADSYVYQELLLYGLGNDSWDDVDGLVAHLAERTGSRVALTDDNGDVLADSSGAGAGPLPSTPTAEIDPSAPSRIVGGSGVFSTVSGGAGESSLRFSGLPAPELSLTREETEQRSALADRATVCVQLATDDPNAYVRADGEVMYSSSSDLLIAPRPVPTAGTSGSLTDPTTTAVLDCVPEPLRAPGAATMELARTQTELAGACLDEVGAPYQVVVDDLGVPSILPSEDDPESMRDWITCTAAAQQEAMEPYLADPALLYIGSDDRFDAFSGDGWIRTVLTGLAVLAAATGVTLLAGRRLAHPIRTLTEAAQQLASGGRGTRVKVTGRDEVARLGHAFNAMASSIEDNERQRKAMVSDIAHELRTPLANVRGYLEAAEDGVVPMDPELITSLLEEAALLQRLIDDLQDLALADAGMLRIHREETDAAELARQVTAAHRATAAAAGSSLTVDAPSSVLIDVDPARLRQALGNLVANAVQHAGPRGHVRVVVARSGSDVLLQVIDNGPGIGPEHVEHLFDRFYRTDTSRTRATGGSGLGLAITKHLVEAHAGTVAVQSVVGSGSTFTIRLPAHAPAAVPA
jgi:two-component system sensor histidine kinase BaeS